MAISLLSRASRGVVARPQKVVLYGPEGIGKTTLAAQFPAPIFLDTEGGTHHMDVTRLDGSNFEDCLALLHELAKERHDYQTLVVDTADWLEVRATEFMLARDRKASIEEYGYGKGYVHLQEEISRFLQGTDAVLRAGVNVVLLAHTQVRKFDQPDQAGSYDRYELKLSKNVAPLLKEWADAVLFARWKVRVVENAEGKAKGSGGKDRVIQTQHSAAFDAKNRHGLPESVPMTFEALAPIFGLADAESAPAPTPRRETAPRKPAVQWEATPAEGDADPVKVLLAENEDAVNAYLLGKNLLAEGQTWRNADAKLWERIKKDPEGLVKKAIADESGEVHE